MAILTTLGAIAGIAGGLGSLFKTGYDMWTNQRDFDYQKNLQNDVFAREDNAVQRRMADLQAAGLNPNLAAGSSAGAGAVVGRSNTPSLSGNSVGTALDIAQHIAQLRNIREENEILKNQSSKSAAEARMANNEALLDNLNLLTILGLKPGVHYNKDGQITAIHKEFTDDIKWLNQDNNLFMNFMKWNWLNAKNSADLLQRDVDYYNSDRFFRYLGNTAGALNNFGNFGKSLPRMR